MAALKRLQWSVDIAAPASRVYQILVAPESYTRCTSAFGEGLYFKGSWQMGQTIRFMTPGGDGVVSDVVESRPTSSSRSDISATSSTARKTQAAKPSALGRQRTRTTPSRYPTLAPPTRLRRRGYAARQSGAVASPAHAS